MTSRSIESAYQYCPVCSAKKGEAAVSPFRCQSCGFVNYFSPVAAVGALVVNDQQQLLLVRRARDPGKGKWGLPGGFVDRDESLEAALEREIQEETSLAVREIRYLLSHPNDYTYRGITAAVIDMFFECRVESASELELEPSELEYHEWVRPTESHLSEMAFESNRFALQSWLESNQ